MGQNLIKFCLVALLLSLWSQSLELAFSVAAFVLLLSFKGRFSKELFVVLSLLTALIVIGLLGLLTFQAGPYEYLKDFVYFMRPLLMLLATYFCVQRLKNKEDFFNVVVMTGFALALFHLVHIGIGLLRFKPNLDRFRGLFGKLNHVEMIALFLVICIKSLPVKRSRFKIIYQTFVVILVVSFLLYFSRTMIVVLGLMVLAYYGYLKLNSKGLVAIGIMTIFLGGFLVFLQNYEPSEGKDVTFFGRFMEKVKNSYTEAFEPIKFDKFKMDRRELWPRWRAYEANLVITEIDEQKKWLQGKGFGSTVDVGFEIRLDGEKIQHLPTVHNGVAYVYMKTGLLGLLVYFSIIVYLYLYYYRKDTKIDGLRYNYVIVSAGLYMFAASMVVTGIFKPYMMVMFLTGGVLALKE